MSVYIKGMEMPGTGRYLIVYPDGRVVDTDIDGESQCIIPGSKAIPVPPHGRLIDADALRQSIKESIDECHKWAEEVEGGEMYARVSQSLGTFVECSLRVKAAPAIIPAEEGEG